MKIKYLIIVSLILAILTIGAVSASDDAISDDDSLANDETQELSLDDDSNDQIGTSQTKDNFRVYYEESIAVNSEDTVIHVSYYDEDSDDDMDDDVINYIGNLTVNVNDAEIPIYNEKFAYYSSLTLNDLNITSMGTYKLVATLVPVSGESVKLLETNLNVTEEEGYDGMYVRIYTGWVNFPDEDFPFVEINYYHNFKGNIQIYLDDELYYNKPASSSEDNIYVANLDKKPKMGKYFVQVKYFDGENTTLVKSKMASIDYQLEVNGWMVPLGPDHEFYIDLPDDATGEVYLIIDGKEYKATYNGGRGTCIVPTGSFELNKEYDVTVGLRNDKFYPDKNYTDDFITIPNILVSHLTEMSVGETQTLLLDMPSKFSGVLKLYNTVSNGDEYDPDYSKSGNPIATANVVNGKASIQIPAVSKGTSYYVYEYSNGDYTYEDSFSITVKDNTAGISASVDSTTVDVGNSVVVKITGPSTMTKAFKIYVDGVMVKEVNITNTGEVTYAVPFTTLGQHMIKVLTDNDWDWDESFSDHDKFYSNNFYITVKEKTTPAPAADVVKLTLKKVNVKKSAKKLVIKATLKINGKAVKGKKLKFKFNKKSYTAKTDKKGVAKITVKKNVLKKLKVGKKVAYQVSYGKTVKKVSVKVKK